VKATVVSTFLASTPNIGDYLIAKATKAALRSRFGDGLTIEDVFRADPWESIVDRVSGSDFIVFACLAVRRNLAGTYHFLPEVMRSGIPYGVLAAGTSLSVSDPRLDIHTAFDVHDRTLLLELAAGAEFFTTRGALTQSTCSAMGIVNARMCGDIAFFDPRFDARRFTLRQEVCRIAISDPHYAVEYVESLGRLIERVRVIFPQAEVDVVLHGENEIARAAAYQHDIGIVEIYRDLEHGLDAYDEYDLHVGYRVHGHVSALCRRIPSYLLEQDGRGCDYGLTLSRRMSVPQFRPSKLSRGETRSIDLLEAIIRSDREHRFSRFIGLDHELHQFNAKNVATLGRL
jgi:hypothetical protein